MDNQAQHLSAGRSLFRRTLDQLHRLGQSRDASGLRGLGGKVAFAGWMILCTTNHPFARGRRLSAAVRQVTWQVWRRFPKTGALAELQNGERLWCPGWSGLAGSWVSVGYH